MRVPSGECVKDIGAVELRDRNVAMGCMWVKQDYKQDCEVVVATGWPGEIYEGDGIRSGWERDTEFVRGLLG